MTAVFELLADEYETIAYGHDAATGLRAIVAIHSTALGPALGGLRFYPYASETAALADVLRLARGMSYKAAAAGLDLGGGKAVVIGDPATAKTPALLEAFGRLVERLGGAYITAADVGTTTADVDVIAGVTDHARGMSWLSGDPSPATAWGVLHAVHAVAEHVWGDRSLADRHVAIQGVGKVGATLARHLADAGARLTIADVDAAAVRRLADELGATVVPTGDLHGVECDVLAPCALGATLDDETIPRLRARGIAGAANNQLARPEHGDALRDAGILYAPDHIVNAGGLINLDCEPGGYDHDVAFRRVAEIGDRLATVFARAAAEGTSTASAADRIAVERIARGRAAAQ